VAKQITDPSWSQTVSVLNTNVKGSRKKSKTGGGKAGLAKVKRTHLPIVHLRTRLSLKSTTD
jgi:hypothetical protein